jgi:carboxypeptidase Q
MSSRCTFPSNPRSVPWLHVFFLAGLFWPVLWGQAQPASTNRPPDRNTNATQTQLSPELIARLRDEGTNRSQIAEIFGYLTDVIGPRLTGSPQCRRANDWTRNKLASWGLTNAHLEGWGPFGRGWSVQRFSAQIVEPQAIPLVAWPKAWSHGSDWPIVAEVVFLDAKTEADLDKYKDKLHGCIALVSSTRDIPIRFEPLATRLDETNLLRLANAGPSARRRPRPRDGEMRRPSSARQPPSGAETNAPAKASPPPPPPPPSSRSVDSSARLRFAVREGAALTVSVSGMGEGGAVSVGSVQVVAPADGGGERVSSSVRPWATNAPAGPPQIELAAEQYNRLVHMIQAGEKLKMAVEVQTQFQDEDLQCYNTIAEIPGTDRKGELVMLGAHLDSAPGGTGATDNAAGVAVCMEAVRLMQVLKLQPRRTIRIGLWTGEEQGLLGSRAYVTQHFGYYTNQTNSTAVRSPREASQQASGAAQEKPSTRRTLVRRRDYKRLSAYYNLDNGAGRIRGIYLQANEALRAIFRPWLEPFRDLGAETITVSNTGGTDHQSFDAIGLPGFQFIQDPIEYWRSYHNSLDVRERAPTADLQQAAIVMAAFVYNTAVREEKLPRKPLEEDVTGNRGR